MKQSLKNNRFVIDLGDMKIDEKSRTEISAEICATTCKYVLNEAVFGKANPVLQAYLKNGGKLHPDFRHIDRFQNFEDALNRPIGDNRFVMDLGDFGLSDNQAQELNGQLGASVMGVLAKSAGSQLADKAFFVPKEYLGIFLDDFHRVSAGDFRAALPEHRAFDLSAEF